MSDPIKAQPLSADAFAAFGDVIEKAGAQHFKINDGQCTRYHDLAKVDIGGPNGRTLINLFSAAPCSMPLSLTMVERHPLGSQAFYPLSSNPFLVVVCADLDGRPDRPHAFVTAPGQGINLARNVWHGVLTPLAAHSDFLVIDRGGDGNNLEEFFFDTPYLITL